MILLKSRKYSNGHSKTNAIRIDYECLKVAQVRRY